MVKEYLKSGVTESETIKTLCSNAYLLLASSAIAPVAEAKPFSDRKDSGIVANCSVGHLGTSVIICAFSDKDGIGAITWINSSGTPQETDGQCENRHKEGLFIGSDGDFQINITDCAGDPNSVSFCFHKEDRKLTQISC